MGLFDSPVFKGIGETVGNIFGAKLAAGPNAQTFGGALLGAGLTFGFSELARRRSQPAPPPIVVPSGFGPALNVQAARQQQELTQIGRSFATPGDSMGFIPGVSGSASFAPAVLAGAGALLPSVLRGAGGVLRNPAVQGALGAGAGILAFGGNGGASGALFHETAAGVRANSIVLAANPLTGRPTFFRHVGMPLLFSGDLTTARRVDKVARRARRKR